MRKNILLLIVLCLLLVGCGKEESEQDQNKSVANNSQIKRYCCTDNGGILSKNNECDLVGEEDYNECISNVENISKTCCNDFNGHWNSYNGECTLNSDDEVDSFNKCLDDRYEV